MELLTDAATLTTTEPNLRASSHHIALRPGTDLTGYVDALNAALQPTGLFARVDTAGTKSDVIVLLVSLCSLLTLMLVVVAGLGVLNTVLLDTRERVRDLGVHKALGMTPRQTIAMVLASVALVGLVGGAIGVPAGVALHAAVLPAMGHNAGINLPASAVAVYHPAELALLGLGGLVIAMIGALLPARRAARARTATALRTE
ncbi:FtsX-like permease family protein [Embleya scabrispora]|uniref:FtsX-like permease family protein n=1 Tax=Embleya scabrispora TaxID=159449 RepID=UPI00036C56F1